MNDAHCQAPGCTNPVPLHKRGRPALYCCTQCRPSSRNAGGVVVEIAHPQTCIDGRPPERVWTVRLRRGQRSVVIAEALGWPSANALAADLSDLLERPRRQKGADID